MATTYKLTYDPSEAKRGFEILAQAIKQAQAAGVTLPPELAAIANRLESVESATVDTAADIGKLEQEVKDLARTAKLADERLGSYAVSTQQVGNAASTAAAKVGQQASAIERTGKVVGGTREGLEKLTGAASALGNESAEVTKGMGILAGVIAAVASPIGAAVAIGASLVSILKSVREGATGLADSTNSVDSFALGMARSFGLISDEAARAFETMQNDRATERFAENMKRGEAAAVDFLRAVKGVGEALDAGRQSREDDQWINQLGDPEAIAKEIDRLRSAMEQLAESNNLSEEEFANYRNLINKLEARRVAILDEQARKEEEARKKRWEGIEKDIAQEDDRHNQRMENIDSEKEAEDDLNAARQKAAEDANKATVDRLVAEVNGLKDVGQEQQRQADEQQRRQEQAKNPYGEGQAFEGGGGNPYAAAMDPLGNALGSGFGEEIGGMGSGGNAGAGPSNRKRINDLSNEIYNEAFRERGFENDEAYFDSMDYDQRDRRRERSRIKRNSRQMAVTALEDGVVDESDPELVVNAQEKVLNKQVEEAARRQKVDDKLVGLMQQAAQVLDRQGQQVQRNEQKIDNLVVMFSRLLGAQAGFRGGNLRRSG